MIKFNKLIIHVDGACRGNPGPGAIGIVIYDNKRKKIKEHSEFIGKTTNNRAEYTALVRVLELAAKLSKGEIKCFSDSENTVKQLNGINKVKDKELMKLFKKVKDLEKMFEKVKYNHVKRENNKRADELANECLDSVLKS